MPATIIEPKPGIDMGGVVVQITVENVEDRERADRSEIPVEQIRRVTTEALVDSGATFLSMPESMIQSLGLKFDRKRQSRNVAGVLTLNVYRGARIEVRDRAVTDEVQGLPENAPVLLGQLPLQ